MTRDEMIKEVERLDDLAVIATSNGDDIKARLLWQEIHLIEVELYDCDVMGD